MKAVLGARTFIDQRSNGADYSAVKHQIALTRTVVGTVIRTDGEWDEAWGLLDSLVEALGAIVFNGSEFISLEGEVLFSITR